MQSVIDKVKTHARDFARGYSDSTSTIHWAKNKIRRLPMVAWFTPTISLRLAIRSFLTKTLEQYADRRESQTTLPFMLHDHRSEDGIWVDFIADTGDGFDSTFGVARIMAEDTLDVSIEDNDVVRTETTHRGSVVLFGGDQVYPDPLNDAYTDRFVRPFEEAFLPELDDREPKATGFAVPGNHDWYDGLNGFMDLFCQENPTKSITGIATPQNRSYWAIRLSEEWFCFGFDWHTDFHMNNSQLREFEKLLDEPALNQGKVILVVPRPAWIWYFKGKPTGYAILKQLLTMIENNNGRSVELVLSGDIHCYTRHKLVSRIPEAECHLVMAGGGGAYLYPVHGLPGVPVKSSDPKSSNPKEIKDPANPCSVDELTFAEAYPAAHITSKMASNCKKLPSLNPAIAYTLIGPLYLLLGYLVLRPTPLVRPNTAENLFAAISTAGTMITTGLSQLDMLIGVLPPLLLCLLLISATVAWARGSRASDDSPGKFAGKLAVAAGVIHGLCHIVFAIALVWAILSIRFFIPKIGLWFIDIFFLLGVAGYFHFNSDIERRVSRPIVTIQLAGTLILVLLLGVEGASVLALTEQIIIVGGFLGTSLIGHYMLCANFLGGHSNDVLVCQKSTAYKNFVRMHINESGALDIYSIGIDSPPAAHEWNFKNGKHEHPDGIQSLTRLIEYFRIER